MSLQAVQAQAGHRNIESTRIYLHMSDEHTPQPTTRDLSADQPVSTPSKRQNSGAWPWVSVWSAVLNFTAPQHHPYRGRDTR